MDSQIDSVAALLRETLEVKEMALKTSEVDIRILKQQCESGDLNTSKDISDHEILPIEEHICQLQADIVVLRTSFHAICGEIHDDTFLTSTTRVNCQAYIGLLLQRYRTSQGAKRALFKTREDSVQDRFQRDVFEAYGAEIPGKRDRVWCVISGAWTPSSLVRAAQIVGHNVGEVTAGHLFGSPIDINGHLESAKNGLPIAHIFEEAIEEGRLAIVPNKEGVLIVVVLDEDIKKVPRSSDPYPLLDITLHGRRLQFPNDFRPSKRYLYFSCCVNFLRHQRHDVHGWNKDGLDQLMPPLRGWASPGDYLRSSTLQKVAQLVGYMTSEEAAGFATRSPFENMDDDITESLDTTHAHIIKAAILGVRSSPEEDDGEVDELYDHNDYD